KLKMEAWMSFRPTPGNTAMQGFTEKIVGMMKSENLFAFGTLPAFPGYGQPAPRHVRLLQTRQSVVSKN
ncbi:hypothetical protein ACJX0J_010435, partial [Zea mays]